MSGGRLAISAVPGLTELLQRQAGLARRAQLRTLGVTSDHVSEHLAAGRWTLVAPEVVSVDNGRLDQEQLEWRAVLHGPISWLGGRSALRHLGLSGYDPGGTHILVPRDQRPLRLSGVSIHVSDRLPALASSGGLPVTSAARAVVDAAAWSPHPRVAAGLVLAAIRSGLARPQEVDAELSVCGRVRYKTVIRECLADAVAGAESLAEVDVVPLIRRAGLPAPRRQVRSRAGRHDLEVDLADGTILVIEVDGPQHDTPEARWADAARDAVHAADGKLSIRIPAYASRHEAHLVVARLRAIAEAAQARAKQSMCSQDGL
jgi:hypothetical protein